MSILDPIVYIIDDDQAMVESLSWIIESIGLKVKTFVRAQEFLDQYDPQQHGCLLLDVRMPGMSGEEVFARLHEAHPGLPIVFLTAFGSKGSGNGQFREPYGVAVNKSNGNVYVADTSNYRIEEFAP